jgi:hypothetical protein
MQKTLTINKRRYTGKQVAAMFDKDNMTNGGDYIVTIGGLKFVANYRQIQDQYFAPVCNAKNANAIQMALQYCWVVDIWLHL